MKVPALPFFGGLKIRTASPASARPSGFSLIELMVACAVLAMMVGLIYMVISQMAGGIKTSTAKIDAFQSARTGFETVSRTLGVATLNTYWDYFDANRNPRGTNTNFTPALYGRQSDLHFLITQQPFFQTPGSLEPVGHSLFFQAPLGYFTNTIAANPPGSLNPCGFFVAFGNDPTKPGLAELIERPRFRLYQWQPSSESLIVDPTSGRLTDSNWVAPTNGVRPLAENIIAFVVRVPSTTASGYSTNATNYGWDSLTPWGSGIQPAQMHQLPPLVNITMVAIEEAAANRLAGTASTADSAASALGITNRSSFFTNASSYDNDLDAIGAALSSKKVPYRVFTTTVPLRGSRWSP